MHQHRIHLLWETAMAVNPISLEQGGQDAALDNKRLLRYVLYYELSRRGLQCR